MDERTQSRYVLAVATILFLGVFIWAIVGQISACSEPGKKTLIVGTNTPFPPFEARNGEDLAGIDIDLAQNIAKSLNRTLVLKDFTEFDALLPALQAGKLDLILSAVTIRDDRKEIVDFSEPYFRAAQALLARQDYRFNYTGNPLGLAGKRIGFQKGTTSEFWLEDTVFGKTDAKPVVFGDINVGLQLLEVGAADLLLLDEPAATAIAKSNAQLAVRGTIDTGEEYGAVVQKNDPQRILEQTNLAIQKMKEDGSLEKLLEKWFREKAK